MAETPAVVDANEGPGKGDPYFLRAAQVAATGNFDYAIDMYIQGLQREPFNIEEHRKLREVGFHRKVAGGKPAGGMFGTKTPFKGKTPKEAMLNAEYLLAKDVGNITHMVNMAKSAAELNLAEVVMWIGPILQEANRTNKSPKVDLYTDLAALFAKVGDYARASQAAELARLLKPSDGALDNLVKQYAAQSTLKSGNYEKGGDFKESIKDRDQTKKLMEEENLSQSDDYRRKAVEAARADYERNPHEMQFIQKYAKALADTEDEASENLAIEVYTKAAAATKVYRFKMAAGDVRIKQLKRNLNLLKEAARQHPDDADLKGQIEKAIQDRAEFELGEFKERSDRFPTDLVIRYEYGRRLYETGHFDEAIGALQEAQNNPKYRVESLHLLGRAFMQQKMLPEALDTLKQSIEDYDMAMSGDTKSKGLHYWYGRALEDSGKVQAAIDIYSQVIRWEFNYLDTKKRLAELRGQLAG